MRMLPALGIGVLAGFMSGLFGVGGGIVLVPLLILLLHLDRKAAHATSLAAVFVIAISGTVGYSVSDRIDVGVGIALGVGGIAGAMYGARLMNRMSIPALRTSFALLLVVMGLRMVVA